MNSKDILIDLYNYDLPREKIAGVPETSRDKSKLLVFNGSVQEVRFTDIDQFLPSPAMMFFNNSRVVEARLLFRKATGATIEIFCLEPDEQYKDIGNALAQTEKVYWKCLVGNASGWPHGSFLEKAAGDDTLRARILRKMDDHFIVEFSWKNINNCFSDILHKSGAIPLPPYIKRKPDALDADRYQTVYAKHQGSVAAPTAGLHFTDELIERIKKKNIVTAELTLHVGAGTFKPVKSDTIGEHLMHAETIAVHLSVINDLLKNQQPVIAVGTTSIRTLESLYWLGVLLHEDPDTTIHPDVTQWLPYEPHVDIEVVAAIGAIKKWMLKKNVSLLIARTSLLIVPGYKFRMVSVLITNFHQPKSTLLLLIAAFIGEEWKNVYSYALENDFRFLSYGDSCLLFRQ